jgi:hypothetical protein
MEKKCFENKNIKILLNFIILYIVHLCFIIIAKIWFVCKQMLAVRFQQASKPRVE